MKPFFKNINSLYKSSSLAAKIRISYAVIIIPILILLSVALIIMHRTNLVYDNMIDSVVSASGFSLDFKSDIDYETYIVIAGVKSFDESDIQSLLDDARSVVIGLNSITDSAENKARLASINKYLDNLEGYLERIKNNLVVVGTYDDNMLIWENDVQVGTTLLEETINQYIYYEVKDLQVAKDENKRTFNIIANILLGLIAAMIIVIIVLSYFIPRSISEPIRRLTLVTDKVADGDLSVRSDIRSGVEINKLSDSINSMIEHINELLEQVTQEQISLRKAEFLVLQSQINPHFLYNTLDAIIWLIQSGKNEEAVRLVGYLSSFFRTSLGHGRDIVTLEEEIKHISSYLDIQGVRYHDILHYEIDIDEEYFNAPIPKITLQPLVENALYHGIKNKRGGGNIRVYASAKKSTDTAADLSNDSAKDTDKALNKEKPSTGIINIFVEDDGAGISPERLLQVREGIVTKASEETGVYGLYNVNERIRLHFGDEYGLTIESEEGSFTRSVIRIPINL